MTAPSDTGELVARLRDAAHNIRLARYFRSTERLAGWEAGVMINAASTITRLIEEKAKAQSAVDHYADLYPDRCGRVLVLEAALTLLLATAEHARFFIDHRKKMHPAGVALFDADMDAVRAILANEQGG